MAAAMEVDPSGIFNEIITELISQLDGREPTAAELQEVLAVSVTDAKLILKQFREAVAEKPLKKQKKRPEPAAVDPTQQDTLEESPEEECLFAKFAREHPPTPEASEGQRTPHYEDPNADTAMEVSDSPPFYEQPDRQPEETPALPTPPAKVEEKKEIPAPEVPPVNRALSFSQASVKAGQFVLEKPLFIFFVLAGRSHCWNCKPRGTPAFYVGKAHLTFDGNSLNVFLFLFMAGPLPRCCVGNSCCVNRALIAWSSHLKIWNVWQPCPRLSFHLLIFSIKGQYMHDHA